MDVRGRVISGLRWTAGARLLGQLFSWAVTIVVIRLLTPVDYGLMAMATIFISFLYLVNTLGLDAVLVQREDLDERTRQQIFGIVIVTNLFFFFALLLAATYIADFFNAPELEDVVRVLSIQFLILIFETMPQAALEREIRFKGLSIVDLLTMALGSVTTLSLAYLGYGVWALVWGHLITITTRVVGLNAIAPVKITPSFSLRGFRETLTFGGYATADRILWFVYSSSDKFIGGKLLGKEILGFYSVADHLAALPVKKLSRLINNVAFPAFSRIQTDAQKVGNYLRTAMRVLSLASFPVFIGISAVAPELVSVFLGEKWLPATVPLQMLALITPLKMISTLLPPLLWGVGRPDISATNFLIASVIMLTAFWVGSDWGATGLAAAWVVAYPIVFLITFTRAARAIGVSAPGLLGELLHPALASLVMYLCVFVARELAFTGAGAVGIMLQLVVAGVIVYAGMVLVFNRAGLREAWSLVRG